MSESSLAYWRQLNALRQKLQADATLRSRFEADPIAVLREQGLDQTFQIGPDQQETMSGLLADLQEPERRATLEALLELSENEELGRVQAATPIANINALANANIKTNANANSNININSNANINVNMNANANANIFTNSRSNAQSSALSLTRGSDVEANAVGAVHEWAIDVVLPEGYVRSELARELRELRLSDARQEALIRRAATDPASLVSQQRLPGGGEVRVVEYTFRGMTFIVECVIAGNRILVRDTEVAR